jgi:hypothetical protein
MLLDDIVKLATDDTHSITVLLRKCVVLAHQLKNDRLKMWANQELNGYDSPEDVPEYRKMPAQAKGNFAGSFGAYLGNRNIPPAVMEPQHRWAATEVILTQGVGAYESVLSEKESGTLEYPWANNMVLYYQKKFIPGYGLISAWQDIPRSALAALIDTVRTRVLNMALEIQSEIGETDADLKAMTPAHVKKVEQTIINNIFGGNVNISTGNSTLYAAVRQQQNIVVGDWEHLAQVLRAAGLSEGELKELEVADQEDRKTLRSEGQKLDREDSPQGSQRGRENRRFCGADVVDGVFEAILRPPLAVAKSP